MKQEAAIRAAQLLRQQRVAALGTLHDGAPSVTLAPFALADDPFAVIVLVSGLASHTRDMLADPRVAVLVAEPAVADSPVHGLARVSIQATARPVTPSESGYESVRAAYLARFPERADLFSLADFALYALEPTAVRVFAGFAQAASITPDSLADAIANSAPTRL
jgi:putative heme iron utilization protein